MKVGLKYVVRSGRHYHFRYAVPQDVRPFIGRREIKKSLQTDDWREAGVRAKQIACRTLELVRNLRKHMLNIEKRENREQLIREVVKRAFDDSLANDERWRELRQTGSEEETDTEVEKLKEAIERERSALARNDLTGIYDHVVHYLTEFDYLDELGGPADLAKLCRESLKAYIVQLRVELARARGDYDNAYDQVTVESFAGAETPALSSEGSPEARNTPQPAVPAGITLATAIDEYVDEQVTGGLWIEKTQIESRAVLRLLLEHFGDVPLQHLTHQRLLHFRNDVLRKVPAHRERKPKYRGADLASLLSFDIPASDRMSIDTMNKYLRRIGGLFGWAVRHQHLGSNPAAGLRYKKKRRSDEERAVYSPENLQAMQAALVELPDHCHTWRYWTPLVALYSGMRQNEIAQLHLDDVGERNGVLCFDVNGNGDDKALKSKAARRLVPVHPHLIDLSLMDYIEDVRRLKKKRVWPNLKKGRDGYGRAVSAWFSKWRKTWLTPEDLQQKKDFHSLRHTFDDRLKQAGVLDARLPQLMGHSLEGDQTFGRYGDLLKPPQLLEAVNLLDLGFDLDKLRREWP